MKIEQQICDAVNVLVDQKLATANFDTTITAVVKSVDDKNKGRYTVEYQGASLSALCPGGATYNPGDEVFVLIANSSSNRARLIIGQASLKDLTTEDYIKKNGDTMWGDLNVLDGVYLHSNYPVDDDHVATKKYVDNEGGLTLTAANEYTDEKISEIDFPDGVGRFEYADDGSILGEYFNYYDDENLTDRNYALGQYSHAEGYQTSAIGHHSHAEGNETYAADYQCHAEGQLTTAVGGSHTEGRFTYADGLSHAEGLRTTAQNYSHAEGIETLVTGFYGCHAEGQETTAGGTYSHAEGYQTYSSEQASHAEGQKTISSGQASHAEGYLTTATGSFSHAEGWATSANSNGHAEGLHTTAYEASHAEGYQTYSIAQGAHAEGYATSATASNSHTEGYSNIAKGFSSHVEGEHNQDFYTSEGKSYQIQMSPDAVTDEITFPLAHLVDMSTSTLISDIPWNDLIGASLTTPWYSATLQTCTIVSVDATNGTITLNEAVLPPDPSLSHFSLGGSTIVTLGQGGIGEAAHVEGWYNYAMSDCQHVQGKYCSPSSAYADIVGNGTSAGRSNAYTLDWSGNGIYAGNVSINGGSLTIGNTTITESQLQALLNLIS